MTKMNPKLQKLCKSIETTETPDDLDKRALEVQQNFMVYSNLAEYIRELNLDESKREGPNKQKKKDSRVDLNDSSALRALFRDQQHRAVQEILFTPFYCTIKDEKIEQHYVSLLSKNLKSDISKLPRSLWKKPAPKEVHNNDLVAPFTADEVRKKLFAKIHSKLSNSKSVGLDRLRFSDLLHSDPTCLLLTALFNACLRLQTVPKSWKETYSVLIKNQKDVTKDDPDITKWKSVTMMNSIPKLFQALLSSRLLVWVKDTGRLSPMQKSPLLTHASCEGSFLVQECKKYAQAHGKDLLIAWLDLRDAASHIPQEAVFHALQKHDVPEPIRNIIETIIIGAKTRIKTSSDKGFTKCIEILHGLPDGAPLNPILITLVLEPILRDLAGNFKNKFLIFNEKINHFAIPDELTLIANSQAELQSLLDAVGKSAKIIGLKFNTNNCSFYHYSSNEHQVEEVKFSFSNQSLKSVLSEKVEDYFGVRQGLSIGQDGVPSVKQTVEHVEAISGSKLDEFQKLNAIHTYILPRLNNCLRGLQDVHESYFEEVDCTFKDKIKNWLGLPDDATSESVVYHTSTMIKEEEKKGRPNQIQKGKHLLKAFIPMLDLFYIMKIVHASEMLNSKDKKLKRIAYNSLKQEVSILSSKAQKEINNSHLVAFLNGSGEISTDSSSLWRAAREATVNLSKKICLSWRFEGNGILIDMKQHQSKKCRDGSRAKIGDEIKKALVRFYEQKVILQSSGTKK